MKNNLVRISAVMLASLLTLTTSPATAIPVTTIELLNPPPDILNLAVGESYTMDIRVTSNEEFILALALNSAYYPGRGIFEYGGDQATHKTSAVLHLTIVGKDSTASLPAVYDWPSPGINWHSGVAPISAVVGVRYKNDLVVTKEFNFAVAVL